MKVLANDGISKAGKNKLLKAGIEILDQSIPPNELADYINEHKVDVLLVRSATKVRKELIDACPGLRMIGRGGVGLDNIDTDYASEKGIVVFNTPAASSQSVAELVFAHLLGLVRQLHDSNRRMPAEGTEKFNELKKIYSKGSEVYGKTLGIVGFGRIGQAVARYAYGLGMRVLAHDPYIQKAVIEVNIQGITTLNIDVHTVSMEEVLTQSDIITMHVPKQANGKSVITADEIEQMKDGVILINAARGGVIDEKDLLWALNNGKVAAAALDVFENEPKPLAELLSHPKVSLTPHTGAATSEAQDRIGIELAQIIIERRNG
jgi:D-3-phosphoglycerate dehydrogenase